MVEIFTVAQPTPIDTGALGAQTAIVIAEIMPDPVVRNFMLKNLRTIVTARVPNVQDSLILVLGDADASLAEIQAALQTITQDFEDRVAYPLGQTVVRRVWDIQPFRLDGAVDGGGVNFMIQWKIPPKGIPVLKGGGLQIYAFNIESNAFTDGPNINTISKVMGGWF